METIKETTSGARLKLYKKLYEFQNKLFGLEINKSGKHTQYKYSTKDDITEAIAPHVKESGLLFLWSYSHFTSTDLDKRTQVTLRGIVKIVDPESGEFVVLRVPGLAEDSQDKALWKTMTGIQKYFWLKQYHLQDNDLTVEPEHDDPRGTRVTKKTPMGSYSSVENTESKSKEMSVAELYAALQKKVKDKSPIEWEKALAKFKDTPYHNSVAELYESTLGQK